MNGIAKAIQMIAWFDENGKINPIKFKYEDENENCNVIIIDQILNRQLEKLAGNIMWKFTCKSNVNGKENTYDLKYDMINSTWLLFK